MELALRIAGASHILLAIAHLPIARHLKWSDDVQRLTLLTRQVFWSHTYFVCLVLAMMGLLGLAAPETLLAKSDLAKYVTTALTAFWAMRLVFQWVLFDWSLWRGKRFETFIHALFTATWLTYVVIYGETALAQWS